MEQAMLYSSPGFLKTQLTHKYDKNPNLLSQTNTSKKKSEKESHFKRHQKYHFVLHAEETVGISVKRPSSGASQGWPRPCR